MSVVADLVQPAADPAAGADMPAAQAALVAEQPLLFNCAGEQLLGIVSQGADDARLGMVIVVGGPQYRAGSHRQFVLLARAVAAAGFPVLRFDYRGMGDGGGALRGFEDCQADIAAAIDALQQAQPGIQRVVLWGLCDGASAALLYLHQQSDPRVAGLALLNPWVRSAASLAKTHVKHYYLQRLRQPDFWRKLAGGKMAVSAVTGLAANLRSALRSGRPGGTPAGSAGATLPYQHRMAAAWAAFNGSVLLLLCDDDHTAREFTQYTSDSPVWRQPLRARPVTRVAVPAADHTCSQPAAQRAVEQATVDWLRQTVQPRCGPADAA